MTGSSGLYSWAMRSGHFFIALCMTLLMGSCVSFLPPTALHQDMRPNRHAVVVDSSAEQAQLLYGGTYRVDANYHHSARPEIEDNLGGGLDLGYSWAERKQSVGFSMSYSDGKVNDDQGNFYHYNNFILRGSYGLDYHEGPWHGHIIKLQGAASKGSGRYQRLLQERSTDRDAYNLAASPKTWLWSYGFGSSIYYRPETRHGAGMEFSFNRSTDLERQGFRAEFFNLDLSYSYLKKYRLHLGGMLDARLTSRAETVYLGLGYAVDF